jgi:molybdate/tungstate transport system ATP-binding protein
LGEIATITLENLTYNLGSFSLKEISLEISKNEYFVLLGPTGAGKTLTLELMAGFYVPDKGRILINGVDVTHLPPEKRNVGFVYQDYSLFPHMTVEENIAFGLEMHKIPRMKVERKVREMTELMGISHLKGRYPSTLSGGEQQRVSLARALAINPNVLLLDEPLSALDPRTQSFLREELKRIHETQNVTTVHVTHNQTEALILADRIGVIMNGEIIQVSAPHELFNKPINERIADFVGVENILKGTIKSNKDGVALINVDNREICALTEIKDGKVDVFIRPENIVLSKDPLRSSARNVFKGKIARMNNLGPILNVELDDGLKIFITKQSAEEMGLKQGVKVYASFKATATHVSRRLR